MIDFAPLQIRRSTRIGDHVTRYRIERAGADPVIVEAGSAAEALKKSGVREATRIVNLDIERLHMLASGLLQPEESSASTSISFDEEQLPQFFQADISEQLDKDILFEELSIGDLVGMVKKAEPAPPSLRQTKVPPVAAMATSAPPVAEIPVNVHVPESPREEVSEVPLEIITEPREIETFPIEPLEPQKELTPEEVRRLLSSDTGESEKDA
jgi:hypothetical protein